MSGDEGYKASIMSSKINFSGHEGLDQYMGQIADEVRLVGLKDQKFTDVQIIEEDGSICATPDR